METKTETTPKNQTKSETTPESKTQAKTSLNKKKKGKFPSNYFNKTNSRAIGRKGGLANKDNINAKYAAQLREMKKRGNSDEQIAFFCKRLEDPEANILHIQKLVDNFIKDNKDDKIALAAMNTLITLHKANFGEKRVNHNLNVNIDLDAEMGVLDEHIAKVIINK